MVRTVHLVLFCSVALGVSSAPTPPKDAEDGKLVVPSEQTSSTHSARSTTSPNIETADVRSGDVSHDGSSGGSKPSEVEDTVGDLRKSSAVHLESSPKKLPVPKKFKETESRIEDTVADLRESSAVHLESSPKKLPVPKKFKGTESRIEDTVADLRESSAVQLESSPKKKPFSEKLKGTESQMEDPVADLRESSTVHLESSSDNPGAVTFAGQSDHPEKALETFDKQEKPIKIDEPTKKETSKVVKKFTNHKKENSKRIKSEKVRNEEVSSSGPESETSKVKLLSEKPPLSEIPNDRSNKEEPTEQSKMVNIQVNNNGRYKNYRYDPETGNFVEDGESTATEGSEQETTHVQDNVDDDSVDDHEPHTSQKEDLKAVREELKKIKSQYGGFFPQLFKSPLSDSGDKAIVKVQVNKNGVSKNYIYSPGKGKVIKFGQLDKSAKYKGAPKAAVNIQYKNKK